MPRPLRLAAVLLIASMATGCALQGQPKTGHAAPHPGSRKDHGAVVGLDVRVGVGGELVVNSG